MAIELPGKVVWLLQHIGITWPTVNEDRVREFGGHVRDFAKNVDKTHRESTATVNNLAQVYQGASYEALLTKWADMSSSHLSELVTACHTVADAMDAAADVIVGMKVDAIAELTALAISFAADQAAAVATLGIAEAGEGLIVKAAQTAVDYLENQLENYIVGQVLEAAVNPLVDVVGRAVSGLLYQATEDALGVSTDAGPVDVGPSLYIHPQGVYDHASLMHGHATTIAGHAADFHAKAAGMSFE